MKTINLLLLTGHVGQDPRQVGKVVRFPVATDRVWRDEAGQTKSATDWVTVTVFGGKTSQFVLDQVRKGQAVSIQAHVAESSYEKYGSTHYATDVIADRVDLLGGSSESTA